MTYAATDARAKRTAHHRLLAHGLYTDAPAIRRTSDDAVVAMLMPHEAQTLADRLDLGMPLEHALRAVRVEQFAVALRRGSPRAQLRSVA